MIRLILATAGLAVVGISFILSMPHSRDIGQADAAQGAAAAVSADMDPFASPANTAGTLGTRQGCARINRNGVQDADEDAVDAVTLDITVSYVPPESPMIGFQFDLLYSEAALTVQSYDNVFFLAQHPTSSLFDANGPAPDTDGNNYWSGAALDTNTTAPEAGSGVLERIVISADSGASTGAYDLLFDYTVHLDPQGTALQPDVLNKGQIAIGRPCDFDDDGVYDLDENACGSDSLSATSRPERIDWVFAGVDDDGDTQIDEALPTGSGAYDCDGDGYVGTAEGNVYSPSVVGDQDPCGTAPAQAPFNTPIGWPADLAAAGTFSANKINISDLASFTSPVRRLDTSPGDAGYNVRWDLVPGNSGLSKVINIVDLNSINTVAPAMLGGVRAYNGPPCPWPP